MADALSRAIASDLGFMVESAATLVEIRQATSRRPFDIILLDYNMPDLIGIEGVQALVEHCSSSRIILFSDEVEREAVKRALEVGVRGYIPKSNGINSLTATLRLVAAGEIYVPLDFITHQSISSLPSAAVELRLSQSDLDMLRAIELGKLNKEIGRQFGMTESRVKMLVRSIFSKLRAKNRTHAVTIAKMLGLI